ncbi:MAG: bifunctional nuclease family protein [Candidatus Omnitrophota bacterium]|nr:bifunctional nuclease family protein [Candidatus Omnitrophota bacterium]RKY34102.1 MAG: bifunctional nuclease family protein [Candidatus Omnitrophota bacterium]RKY36041.1 MAG: bifunctional nuclease family protein [Candidatus Omnitrophota bacterium]RKY46548.1 MAG: bifunctional nuclease family protein [Candidatus Omnitrophota bacterium]HDN86514.1 bifunctional nuclease family protein [Candidatus Omnitrophota bacterium]
MIEVELSRIIIDEEKREQIIVLREKNGSKTLPIVIGLTEALAVRMKLSGFMPPRPLTHDLMKSLFDALEVRLEKVVIDKLVDSTFHAKLFLITKEGTKVVDARPSDSIALAVRTNSPVFVEEEVFRRLEQGL